MAVAVMFGHQTNRKSKGKGEAKTTQKLEVNDRTLKNHTENKMSTN